MSLEIWIPQKARPKFQCNVPGCGAKFQTAAEMGQHVPACARRNGDELEAAAHELAKDPFLECQDPEFAEWTERVNKDFHLR